MGWLHPRCVLLLLVSFLLLVLASGVAVRKDAARGFPSIPSVYIKALQERGIHKGILSRYPSQKTSSPEERGLACATPRCHWCHGKADAVYPDMMADPPCSVFFTCQRESLVAIDTCPRGSHFSAFSAECGALADSSCAADAPAVLSAASAMARDEGAAGFMSVARGGSVDASRRRLIGPGIARPSPYLTNWVEVNALLALKANTFDPYYRITNWVVPPVHNQSNFICKWSGVTCTGGSVTELNLNGFGLAGSPVLALNSIPPQIGNLTALKKLDLGGTVNRLVGLIGEIPPQIGQLRSLDTLFLADNKLVGSLPASMSNLASLTSLDLQFNNITGSLSAWVGELTALKILHLGVNGFTGPLPPQLGQLTALEELSLRTNYFSGALPETLANLKTAYLMELLANEFSGPLPDFVSDMTGMVDLSFNNFSGPFPASWANFKGSMLLLNNAGSLGRFPSEILTAICADGEGMIGGVDLTNTSLTGELDWDLSKCPNMFMMYLEGNQLTGDVGKFLRAIPAASYMSDISLGSNRLTGEIPPSIFMLPALAGFSVQENSISGPLPLLSCTGALKGLQPAYVNVSVNQLTGDLPSTWAEGCNMNQLFLGHNRFTGPVPPPILDMQALAVLDLTGNAFTGAIPVPKSCVGKEPNYLFTLRVGQNKFSGEVPEFLGKCKQLQELDLSGLDLSGGLPDRFFDMGGGSSVISVNLSSSAIEGPISVNISHFTSVATIDLSNNRFSSTLPPSLGNFPMLRTLDISGNNLSGLVPPTLANLTAVTRIDMGGNRLVGDIPPQLAPQPSSHHLAFLSHLDLSSNQFTGPIPYGFANASSTDFHLNISNNELAGAIPGGSSGYFAAADASVLADNEGLCGMDGYPACPNPNSLSAGVIAGIAVGALVGLLAIGLGAWWFSRRNDPWSGGTMLVFEKLDFRLTVQHILEATEHFSDKYKLGRGGFGTVYRATLQDGRTVAIKRLAAQSTQGNREFQAEMETLGNIRHRNLVVLVAAYIAPGQSTERLLIYDFLSGGSVDTIFSKDLPKDSPFCHWSVRRSVALDTARGMKYLHHDCTPRIIHRDMKPANVLLDDQMVAYVADFGLAREIDVKQSHMSTKVFGTIGYLAPEYTRQGRLSFKSDVFAYGVMLLQLITGKQPTDEEVAERGLARWAEANGAAAIVDSRMHLEPGEIDQILGAVKLGLLCTARVAADRPSMPEIVHLLENLEDFAKGVGAGGKGDGKGE